MCEFYKYKLYSISTCLKPYLTFSRFNYNIYLFIVILHDYHTIFYSAIVEDYKLTFVNY